MSALPVEAVEPDPAATSLPNDETVNKDNGTAATPDTEAAPAGDVEAVMKDAESPVANIEEVNDRKEAEKADREEKPRREKKLRTYENGVLKTSAQVVEGKNNSKYDASILPESADASKIRAQVEFYFSDSNLPTDDHLWKLTEGEQNKPVSIRDEIMKFGRMKRFKDTEVVVAALKESKFLNVTGEDGQETVNRILAYDPKSNKASMAEARSIYAKGFGDEEPSSQFDIEAFFAPYGPTNSVRLRRTDDKLFKGSVFVEFQDEETQKKFLDLDPKPLWKGQHILMIQSKREYVKSKEQDIKDGKIDPHEARTPWQQSRGGRGGRGRGRGRGRGGDSKGGDRDPEDWKKRREDDRASGFRDDRKNGRGGRDNKRGGRGGRRDDRGPRSNDRNQEREDKDKEVKTDTNEVKSETKAEIKNEEPSESKRSREDDGGAEGNPAKKVKTEVTAES